MWQTKIQDLKISNYNVTPITPKYTLSHDRHIVYDSPKNTSLKVSEYFIN
jgi:hypothetical protein